MKWVNEVNSTKQISECDFNIEIYTILHMKPWSKLYVTITTFDTKLVVDA